MTVGQSLGDGDHALNFGLPVSIPSAQSLLARRGSFTHTRRAQGGQEQRGGAAAMARVSARLRDREKAREKGQVRGKERASRGVSRWSSRATGRQAGGGVRGTEGLHAAA
jgi:hypothetical protein